MIAFKHNRPVLQVGAGFIAEYGFDWLGSALDEAARKADTTLPFKQDLIAAISLYLEDSCPLDVLQVDELYGRIRRMLCEVGLAHLADNLPVTPPPYPVNIGCIAERNPLPLFFINELDHELAKLHDLGLTDYLFTDIRPCVMTLLGQKKWTKSCDRLLADIEFLLLRYSQGHAA